MTAAYRFRWLLLVLACACLIAAFCWFAGPWLSGSDDAAPLAPFALLPPTNLVGDSVPALLGTLLGLLLLTQWMYLRPRRGWTVRLSETGRPMKSAVLAAAYMAMMLSLGGIAIVLELFQVWGELFDDSRWQIPFTAGVVALWILWAAIFYAYWRKGSHFEQLRAMAHALLVGSILELLVATGVYVWKTDEDNCWCARGSYTALVFSATAMLWAFGPGLLFLFLREARYRRHS